MTPELLLFLLRLLIALILIGFLCVLGWFFYQDLRTTAEMIARQERQYGRLRVIANSRSQPAVNTVFPLLPVTSIGRAHHNTIVLDDHYVSAEHVLITRRGEQWWLEDLGSRNGTLLNDLPLTETAVVTSGDIITIGHIQLKVELIKNG